MTGLLLRRTIGALLTLVAVVVLTFFLLRLAPGGPFDSDKAWPPEVKKNIEARYGLDQPVWRQFIDWGSDAIQGDFRESFHFIGKPVSEILAETFPISLSLGIAALAIAILVGIPMGAYSAWRTDSFGAQFLNLIAVSGVSLPNYLAASLLILFFAIHLGWLPAALWDEPSSIVLPAIALSIRPACMIARLVRSSMIDVLDAPFIRTAFAKGLNQNQMIHRHALRNSLIPVVTLLGPLTANLITGSFVIEYIFQIPGLGKHFISAVMNRDYPLVLGVTSSYGVLLVSANLVVDLAYGWIDPRVRAQA